MKKLLFISIISLFIFNVFHLASAASLPEGTFAKDSQGDYYGDLYIRGYATVEQREEGFCEENCKVYDYVTFNVLETTNKALKDFLKDYSGNSYVSENGVGIGCFTKGILHYWNASDALGMQEHQLSALDSRNVLNSSAQQPITLKLTRFNLTLGSGAPTCYSHFSKVEVL